MSPLFATRAVNRGGEWKVEMIRAPSPQSAAALLVSRGLYPVKIQERRFSASFERPPSSEALGIGFRVLSDMILAGIPVLQSLDALQETAPKAWRNVIPEVREAVQSGGSLSEALETGLPSLSPTALGMIRAGESAGDLGTGMRRAAEHLEAGLRTKRALAGALSYPALLFVTGGIALLLMLFVVLPRFESILAELGAPLPVATQRLLGLARAARAGAIPGLAGLGCAALAWLAWVRTAVGRNTWDRILLAMPLLGGGLRASWTARLAEATAALLMSGLPLPVALEEAAAGTANAHLREQVLKSRSLIMEGYSLGQACARTGALTPTAVFLLAAAEQSGDLPDSLKWIAHMEAARAERILSRTMKFVEPALILVFAVAVALVSAALLQTLYGLRPV